MSEFTIVDRLLQFRGTGDNFELAPAFLYLAASDMVDDQAAHDARGIAHESGAIGKRSAIAGRNLNVSLMQEGGRTETEGDTLAA